MNRGELKTEILVRSGKDTQSAWTSEAFLNDWINQNHRWAAGYKPWPFTEGRTSTTYASTEEWSFEGYKADSFRIMTIGGKKLKKLNFNDYLIFRETQPTGDDRVFSDFGGLVYVNPYVDLSGTLVAYGQYQPADIPDGDGSTADDADTVFSQYADEGNQAIIERTLGYIAMRDGDKGTMKEKYLLANNILDGIWQRIEDEQYNYETHPDSGGMFDRIDVLRGRFRNVDSSEDQFI